MSLFLVPILLPIVENFGISAVHFGTIVILNLNLGLLTPPVDAGLYTLGRVANAPFERVVKGTLPFVVPLVIVLLLLTFVP